MILNLTPEQFELIKEKISIARDNCELAAIAPLSIKTASFHDFHLGCKYMLDTLEDLLSKCVEELPVNEDCLFQPVLFDKAEKVTLISFGDGLICRYINKDSISMGFKDSLTRIPGFNYKKPEWL